MRSKLRMSIAIVAVLALVGVGTIFFGSSAQGNKADETNDPPALSQTNVKVQQVELSSMVKTISLTGQTKPEKEVKFSSEISGQIEYLPIELGTKIKKGRTLARIDYQMVKAQADQAQAQYDLAKKTLDRNEILLKKEMVSPQHIDEMRAKMLAADAQLRIANANLKKAIIRANSDGIVTGKYVEKGEFVSPGTPIVQIVDTSKIIIEAQVPEYQISHVKPGDEVTVTIDALAKEYGGKVDMVVPKADPVSGTFAVRVKAPNPSGEIYAGMSARMTINSGILENVVVVPQDIVIEESQNRFVFIEQNGIAIKKNVNLGAIAADQVVIEGIAAGDNLIVLGHRDLLDGNPVNIVVD